VVRSCAYPYTTLLGGIRGWIPRGRLSRPLHNVDGQSQSWGVCIILASRREELHLYSLPVITDLAVSTPHPWLCSHFEGTDRRDPLNVGYRAVEACLLQPQARRILAARTPESELQGREAALRYDVMVIGAGSAGSVRAAC